MLKKSAICRFEDFYLLFSTGGGGQVIGGPFEFVYKKGEGRDLLVVRGKEKS